MSTVQWRHSQSKPHELFYSEQYDELLHYAEDNQRLLHSLWSEEGSSILEKTLRLGSFILGFFQELLKPTPRDYAVLRIGALIGTIENFEYINYEKRQHRWFTDTYLQAAKATKHLDKVIQALETHGIMTHSELSDYLGMQPPTLTEAMKKIIATGSVQVDSRGKYKIYSLSDIGIRYGKQIRKSQVKEKQLDEILADIKSFADNSLLPHEKIIHEIQEIFGESPKPTVDPGDIFNIYDEHHRLLKSNLRVDLICATCNQGTTKKHIFASKGITNTNSNDFSFRQNLLCDTNKKAI